jgi:hypothetical protein
MITICVSRTTRYVTLGTKTVIMARFGADALRKQSIDVKSDDVETDLNSANSHR